MNNRLTITIIIVLLCLVFTGASYAQTGILKGAVTDYETGESLELLQKNGQ